MTAIKLPSGVMPRYRLLEAGRVYTVAYRCDTPGPDVEEGAIEAFWTGDVDAWGKLTFRPVDGRPPYYLFPREFVSVEAL